MSGRQAPLTMKRRLLVSYLSITAFALLVLEIPLAVSAAKGVEQSVWLLLVATGGAVLGIVLIVSLLLARSMTKPLDDLRDAAAGLGNGDFARRATVPRGPAELTMLAESFNTTAAHLEDLVGSQRAFVADASHQLRTPLAALRLRLENLEAETTGVVAEDLEGALAEVSRLSNLVDGLIVLARAEQASSAPEDIDVDALLNGRAEAWSAFAAEREVFIRPAVAAHPFARATPGRLEQVIDNLLNNALEVAPAYSSVWLVAATRPDCIEVRVRDEGPGMEEDERARAFDRFWQSGAARREGRPNGHFGLGLAIVRKLVVSDGGDVKLEASPGGGLEVVVRMRRGEPLPAVPPAARDTAKADAGAAPDTSPAKTRTAGTRTAGTRTAGTRTAGARTAGMPAGTSTVASRSPAPQLSTTSG